MLNEADIREALRACYYAADLLRRPINIVDLGLIASIVLTLDMDAPGAGIVGVPPRQRLTLRLFLPSNDQDAQTLLQAQVLNRLAGLPELSHTTITFVARPFQIINHD